MLWCSGYHYCTTTLSEIHDGEVLWQWSRLQIKLNAFCWPTIPQKQFIIIIISPLLLVLKKDHSRNFCAIQQRRLPIERWLLWLLFSLETFIPTELLVMPKMPHTACCIHWWWYFIKFQRNYRMKGKKIYATEWISSELMPPNNYIVVIYYILLLGVSQKFPIWVVRCKLGISELWSRGVWGPTLIRPQWDSGQSPWKFWLFDTYKALESV